uniref:YLP motif-containing protein 1 n=1 Tax=Dendroctonus ponderosae TaxID=77166 RepID=A0AAR5Q2W0_DENPD
MSWQSWHQTAAPPPNVMTAPPMANAMGPTLMQSAVIPGNVNAAPSIVAPPTAVQYSTEQWSQMQQQNWQQWAQWQQQYHQWHQQYGAEYEKSINALTAVGPNTAVPPPLPTEAKHAVPPPPPDNTKLGAANQYSGYTTAPPPGQFASSVAPSQYADQQDWKNSANKRSLPASTDVEPSKRQMLQAPKNSNSWQNQPPPSAQTPAQKALNLEELTEAEKKFDKEFAAWEAQFNKWKEQNANHPDKSQYLEYEKKWDSWRNSLLDRREQMRKKRVALQASMTAHVTTPPILPQQQQKMQFKQPPPLIGQSFSNQGSQRPVQVFDKPPPTHNNAHLSFKQPPTAEESSDVGNNFLKTSSPTPGGIPGLDLVKESSIQEYNEVPGEQMSASVVVSKGPDLDAISRGINTILGDAKLLNLLSMVSQNKKVPTEVVETERKVPEAVQARTSISSLMATSVQRPHFSKSSHEVNDYAEDRQNSVDLVTVNNFDDQTRMSFSNGPNEADQGSNSQSRLDNSHNLPRGDYRPGFHQEQNNFRGFNGDNRPPFAHRPSANYSQNHPSDYHKSFGNQYDGDDQWNEEEEYDKYHDMFNEEERSLPDRHTVEPPPVDKEPFFVPDVVIDYEHRPLKDPEPEISLDVIRAFDYRHKPVNRIPYPQRPQWLANTLRNIRQFETLAAGRFNINERSAHVEREMSRYPVERVDSYGRRLDDCMSFSRDVYDGRLPYNERERERVRFDYDQRGRGDRYQPDRRAETRNRIEKKAPDVKGFESKMELEDLSDEDWEDDKKKTQRDSFQLSSPTSRVVNITSSDSTAAISSNAASNQYMTLEDLINAPGRFTRPPKIAIIMRGPPGSGKTYLAKLIKDREVENGGSAPRILSLDDYFMIEHEREVIEDGKVTKIKEMTYEYEAGMEESYRQCLIKAFKKTVTDGYFPFVIVDNVNQKVKSFGEMWSFAKQNGFQVYICQLDLDPELCTKRNIHHRSESYIENCIAGWEPTPSHHPMIDATNFLQSTGAITEVEMEEAEPSHDDADVDDGEGHTRSKWDSFDCSLNNLARLDGVNKPLRPSRTMEEYLQLDDEWEQPENPTKPGQKRVRWADLEEQKQQTKMKALGFVVGQTNWQRIMDPTNGESALTQTKYIERRYNN